MPVEEELAKFHPEKDMLLTIGVFDGVHIGHKYLLSRLTERAKQQDLLSGVVTFRRHPQELLSPQTKLPRLTNITEKVKLLKDEGIDAVVSLSFTKKLAGLSARQFVSLLKKHLRMRGLIVGTDFALGRNREGNADMLRALGQEMNFSVNVVPPLKNGGEVVSSTAIRKTLADGNMKRATSLLGRPFSLQGRVTTGVGRGSKLGFPTTNLETDPKQALPADGVYATRTHINDKIYQSVTNIGHRPTFGENERTIETFILDYKGNLYGRKLKIDIVERLRNEKRFDNEDELKKQIAEDVKQAIAILTSKGRK